MKRQTTCQIGFIMLAQTVLRMSCAGSDKPEIACELLPAALIRIKEVHRSRYVTFGWREPKWDDAGELSSGEFLSGSLWLN